MTRNAARLISSKCAGAGRPAAAPCLPARRRVRESGRGGGGGSDSRRRYLL